MITAFLPCRRGSSRVPNKNVKKFAHVEGGLLEIKLRQLLACKEIDQILVSSNDIRVLEFTRKLNNSRLLINERPDSLGSSETTTDKLIKYVPEIISEGDILWTHVTSPFVNENDYSNIINAYKNALLIGYDSLMTVLKLQGFIWNSSGPLSYDRDTLKWPMTQNITPLYEIDSAVFLSSAKSYLQHNDRIGKNPFLYEQDKSKSIDIDWPEDFLLAEKLWML